jgi:exopolysaccharide production protein ExoZ
VNAESAKIDALRGASAIAVLFAHADGADLVKSAWLTEHKSLIGHAGVDLFFVLSGCLIWRSAKPLLGAGRLGTYAINRTTRILPLYWVSIAFCVFALPFLATFPELNVTEETLFRHLTFTQTYEPNVSRTINPILWSLSFEATFYVLIVALFFVAKVIRPAWWLLLFSLLGTHQVAAEIWKVVPAYKDWVYPFMKFAPLFMLRIILEEVRRKDISRMDWLAVALGVTAAGVSFASHVDEDIWPVLIACVSSLLYICPVPAWTRFPLTPLAWAGVISYSLYIWHYIIIGVIGLNLDAVRSFIGPIFNDDLIRASMVISFTLVISAVSYFVIERPFMGPIRSWLTKPRTKLAYSQ